MVSLLVHRKSALAGNGRIKEGENVAVHASLARSDRVRGSASHHGNSVLQFPSSVATGKYCRYRLVAEAWSFNQEDQWIQMVLAEKDVEGVHLKLVLDDPVLRSGARLTGVDPATNF